VCVGGSGYSISTILGPGQQAIGTSTLTTRRKRRNSLLDDCASVSRRSFQTHAGVSVPDIWGQWTCSIAKKVMGCNAFHARWRDNKVESRGCTTAPLHPCALPPIPRVESYLLWLIAALDCVLPPKQGLVYHLISATRQSNMQRFRAFSLSQSMANTPCYTSKVCALQLYDALCTAACTQ
jgi:hypothetical protein